MPNRNEVKKVSRDEILEGLECQTKDFGFEGKKGKELGNDEKILLEFWGKLLAKEDI